MGRPMLDCYCANCGKRMAGMIYLGWGLCAECRKLTRRKWEALRTHVRDPKQIATMSGLILAGIRREDGEDTDS